MSWCSVELQSTAWWQPRASSASAELVQSTASTAHGCFHGCWLRCLPACPTYVGVKTASTHLHTTPVASCTRYQLPNFPDRQTDRQTGTSNNSYGNSSSNWSESTLGPHLICCTEPQNNGLRYTIHYTMYVSNSIYTIPHGCSALYNTLFLLFLLSASKSGRLFCIVPVMKTAVLLSKSLAF